MSPIKIILPIKLNIWVFSNIRMLIEQPKQHRIKFGFFVRNQHTTCFINIFLLFENIKVWRIGDEFERCRPISSPGFWARFWANLLAPSDSWHHLYRELGFFLFFYLLLGSCKHSGTRFLRPRPRLSWVLVTRADLVWKQHRYLILSTKSTKIILKPVGASTDGCLRVAEARFDLSYQCRKQSCATL